MPEYTSLLEEALEAWADARAGLIQEVRVIPAGKFGFRPVEGVRSLHEMVVHILEVAMMMVGELTRPDTNLRRAPWPKLLELYARPAYAARTKADLLALLKSQHREGDRKFRRAGELHMLQFIERFDGKPGTRLAWFHHGIAQEMYHRGQITTYQRILGIEPALTRLIRGG
jgi:uncharacterized damage-inducible protein DinB